MSSGIRVVVGASGEVFSAMKAALLPHANDLRRPKSTWVNGRIVWSAKEWLAIAGSCGHMGRVSVCLTVSRWMPVSGLVVDT